MHKLFSILHYHDYIVAHQQPYHTTVTIDKQWTYAFDLQIMQPWLLKWCWISSIIVPTLYIYNACMYGLPCWCHLIAVFCHSCRHKWFTLLLTQYLLQWLYLRFTFLSSLYFCCSCRHKWFTLLLTQYLLQWLYLRFTFLSSLYFCCSGSRSGAVHHHDVRVAEHHVGSLAHHTQEVCGLAWSPDGKHLASGANDNLLCVWDGAMQHDLQPLHSFTQHQAAVKVSSHKVKVIGQ